MDTRFFFTDSNGETIAYATCWTTSRWSGFTHHCSLNAPAYDSAENKACYYNRTWESYTFQTCMRGAAYNAREYRRGELMDDYKAAHGYARMTAKRRAAFDDDARNDDALAFWSRIYDAIDDARPTWDSARMGYVIQL